MKKDFELKTQRLVLKPLGIKYLDTVFKYSSDIENTNLMMFLPDLDISETIDYLNRCDDMWNDEDNQTYECAILLDDVQIGSISLELLEDGDAEFGWILNKDYWGHGYVTEAALMLLDFGINSLGFKHFIAHCDSENSASYKVMEKLGMKLHEKNAGRKNKLTPKDEERYELVYRYDVL